MDNIVMITGATGGLGRALALDLAARGATLLLHGRDHERLESVAEEARRASEACTVRTHVADLADLREVADLAERVRADESRLDVLVNNAAVGGGEDPTQRQLSAQGHELRLAVNHLAPHLLTRRLTPLLSEATPGRVVNVTSAGQAPVDFEDLMMENAYEGVRAYCRSKLALIMSTFDLAEELDGSGVTVNAVHPAHLMDTPMVQQSGFHPLAAVDEGVGPVMRLISAADVEGVTGRYFDRFADRRAHEQAYDEEARLRLRKLTEELVGS
jgi:NAD(P)-dependent dehydrogenase (short-subunit alcohol dehydrogenase family)